MKTRDGSEAGFSTEFEYETAEIKYCPICGRVVQETYRCVELNYENETKK